MAEKAKKKTAAAKVEKLPENWSGAEDEYGNLFSAVDGKILTNIPAYGTKIMHRIDAAQKEEVQLKYRLKLFPSLLRIHQNKDN